MPRRRDRPFDHEDFRLAAGVTGAANLKIDKHQVVMRVVVFGIDCRNFVSVTTDLQTGGPVSANQLETL